MDVKYIKGRIDIVEIKLGDVYRFSYNAKYEIEIFMPYHCFDGILFVKQKSDGSLYLEDTYWGSGSDNRIFTLEKALEQGTLTFICNINDIELCYEHDYKYYDSSDLFNLSHQHGCCKRFFKRKGAVRSSKIMEENLKKQIEERKHDIKSAEYDIERYMEYLDKLKSGDNSFYF